MAIVVLTKVVDAAASRPRHRRRRLMGLERRGTES